MVLKHATRRSEVANVPPKSKRIRPRGYVGYTETTIWFQKSGFGSLQTWINGLLGARALPIPVVPQFLEVCLDTGI